MMTLKKIAWLLPGPIVLILTGCFMEITEPPDTFQSQTPDYIRITEIAVTNEQEASRLDIEVHMFDANDNQFLGCSGNNDGLQRIDVSDSLYHVKAFFRGSSGRMTYDAIRHKQIYLEVIEDDTQPCPVSPTLTGPWLTPVDDLIGRSPAFSGEILSQPQIMRFGNVTHLKLVRSRQP